MGVGFSKMGVVFLKMGVNIFENGSWKRGWHVQVQDLRCASS